MRLFVFVSKYCKTNHPLLTCSCLLMRVCLSWQEELNKSVISAHLLNYALFMLTHPSVHLVNYLLCSGLQGVGAYPSMQWVKKVTHERSYFNINTFSWIPFAEHVKSYILSTHWFVFLLAICISLTLFISLTVIDTFSTLNNHRHASATICHSRPPVATVTGVYRGEGTDTKGTSMTTCHP